MTNEQRQEPIRLNLGAGALKIEGWTAIDRSLGTEAYPLTDYADDSVEEIRASHILEHFPAAQAQAVVDEWARALRPGGRLRIAVPGFENIMELYKQQDPRVGQFLMGGQVDDNDYHKSAWNEGTLRTIMENAGLCDIKAWKCGPDDDIVDCASLPVSMNLEGLKRLDGKKGVSPATANGRPELPFKVVAAMSMPRLCFTDNFHSAFGALAPLGISINKHGGAYWEQAIDRSFTQCLKDGADVVLALDYDTIFTSREVMQLIDLMHKNPDVDAIVPLQQHRTLGHPLLTIRGKDGQFVKEVPVDTFMGDLSPISSGHFGLTLIRASALRALPRPWFQSAPAPDGTWGEGRMDADIYFWRQMEKLGLKACLAPRVVIGHAELVVMWPNESLGTELQYMGDYNENGRPGNVWK